MADNTNSVGVKTYSQNAVNLIRTQEGFSAVPYRDANGWSIGFGFYMGKYPTMKSITMADAEKMLKTKMDKIASVITTHVTVPLNQNQFDALESFVYNVGDTAFIDSTLLKDINAGNFTAAAAQFPLWIHSDGKVNPALVARRQAELNIFEA